jgi:tryptophan synthase alpha chain
MQDLRTRGQKAFVAYIMSGEPSWDAVSDIVIELERRGVTAVELGVPFSDPIADGPVIQAAGNRALAQGVTLDGIFSQVSALRRKTQLPILLMGYWNVFLQYGREKTLRRAEECGVDGFIIADLPPEAEPEFFEQARDREICTVLLAAELTSESRLEEIARISTGFVYYVPQLGITGLDLHIEEAVKERIRLLKTLTETPLCIGIGVKTRDDVRALWAEADGVIVGTRIVDFIDQNRDARDLAAKVGTLVSGIKPEQP